MGSDKTRPARNHDLQQEPPQEMWIRYDLDNLADRINVAPTAPRLIVPPQPSQRNGDVPVAFGVAYERIIMAAPDTPEYARIHRTISGQGADRGSYSCCGVELSDLGWYSCGESGCQCWRRVYSCP